MDRLTEHPTNERDIEREEAAAPTAADAAVQQVPVEANSTLRFPAERDRSQLADAPSGTVDLSATVRYLAAMKGVPLTPQQVSAAANWAGKTLLDGRLAGSRVEDVRLKKRARDRKRAAR